MPFFNNPIQIPGTDKKIDNIRDAFNILFMYETARFLSDENQKTQVSILAIGNNVDIMMNNMTKALELDKSEATKTINSLKDYPEKSIYVRENGKEVLGQYSQKNAKAHREKALATIGMECLNSLKNLFNKKNTNHQVEFLASFSKYNILNNQSSIENIAWQILMRDEFKHLILNPQPLEYRTQLQDTRKTYGDTKTTHYTSEEIVKYKDFCLLINLARIYQSKGLNQMEQMEIQQNTTMLAQQQQIQANLPLRVEQAKQEAMSAIKLAEFIQEHIKNDNDNKAFNFIQDSLILGIDLKNITFKDLEKTKSNCKKSLEQESEKNEHGDLSKIAHLRRSLDIFYKYTKNEKLFSECKALTPNNIIRICTSKELLNILRNYEDIIQHKPINSNIIIGELGRSALGGLQKAETILNNKNIENISQKSANNKDISYMLDIAQKTGVDVLNLDKENIKHLSKHFEKVKDQYKKAHPNCKKDLNSNEYKEYEKAKATSSYIEEKYKHLKELDHLNKYQLACHKEGIYAMPFSQISAINIIPPSQLVNGGKAQLVLNNNHLNQGK